MKQFAFSKLPPVFCFHLKRFEQSRSSTTMVKLDHHLPFPVQGLDMAPYVAPNVKSTCGEATIYDLFAVVEHVGSMDAGHYIAFVRRSGEWFRCDDSFVSAVPESELKATHAYLLFYARRGYIPPEVAV